MGPKMADPYFSRAGPYLSLELYFDIAELTFQVVY